MVPRAAGAATPPSIDYWPTPLYAAAPIYAIDTFYLPPECHRSRFVCHFTPPPLRSSLEDRLISDFRPAVFFTHIFRLLTPRYAMIRCHMMLRQLDNAAASYWLMLDTPALFTLRYATLER